ncbi:MAG: hypothetical protein ACT4NY_26285 [Pseudonocardiales bacterium]
MIGNGTGKELIDQAFFAFQGGLTIVASSLSSNDEELKWLARLRQHVRLQNHPETRLPSHALSYFLFSPEEAAVLRRVNRGDSVGRNNSHVLIGSPRVLTAGVALGLELWPSWQADPPEDRLMPRLQPGELDGGFDPAEQFRAQVRDRPGDLERVLGWLLEKPDRPLSIIGCPEEDRVALLWGLLEIGERDLAPRGLRRDWTFSTYETEHGDAIKQLPETVCLPARPFGTSAARRTSVDLTRSEPIPPRAANQARALVAQYIRNGPAHGEHGGPVVAEQERSALAEQDRSAPAEQERSAPAEQDWSAPAEQDWSAPADPAQGPPPGPQSASTPAVSTSSTPGPAGSPDLAWMVRSLMLAEYPQDFEEQLSALERHARTGLARQEIRAQLDSDNYGIVLIDRLFASSYTDRETAFKRIIDVAFGSTLVDFKDAAVREYVTRLIERYPKNEFIRTLLQVVEKNNREHQIVSSAVQDGPGQQRLTALNQAQGGRSDPTPFPVTNEPPAESKRPVSPESPARPVWWVWRVWPTPARSASVELSDKYNRLRVTAGWILVSMLSFVVGLFAGGFFTPDPAAVASPAPAPPESAPATTDPPAVDLPDVVVTRMDKDQLTLKPNDQLLDDEQLWLLVKRGDGALFPQPKKCLLEDDNWTCTQIYNFSDPAANYSIVLVIADQKAADSFGKYGEGHSKENPGAGITELPLGARKTDLILTVPSQ